MSRVPGAMRRVALREALLRRTGTPVTLSSEQAGPRLCSAPLRKCYALRCVRGTDASIPQRAAVLARFGAAGERALVPVDPDRLAAAERRHEIGGLVADLLQPLDDLFRHPVLQLI